MKRALLLIAALALGAAPAAAQMPNLRAVAGKPLPVADLATGTIVVRVARKVPANAVVGVEVSAVVKPKGQDARKQTAKTGNDGRATFSGLPPGAEFQATVSVDTETLESSRFDVPAQGGVRVMLVAELGAGGGEGEGEGASAGEGAPSPHQKPNFRMGAVTGSVEPATNLPKGTLELALSDEQGKPLAGILVRLGVIALDSAANANHVKVQEGTSDAEGRVRWQGLPTGAGTGYAAVFERNGTRLSTEPFRMSEEAGMRGKLSTLGLTADPAVLRIDNRSRIAIDVREDNVTVMAALVFQNVSRQTYDPGPAGLLIRLPADAISAQEIEGGAQVEVNADGAHIHAAIPPNTTANFATQAMFGYVLPGHGETTLEVRQPTPVLMERPLIIVPEKSNLKVSAPGLESLGEDVNRNGEKLRFFSVPEVPAGGVLALTVTGVPAHDRSGAFWAAVLCLLLVAAAIIFGRSSDRHDERAAKEALVARREKLFAELIGLERRRRSLTAADPMIDGQRKDLVARLDAIYRDLAEREAVL